MKVLATKEFKSRINLEGSWGGHNVYESADSTMELYGEDDGTPLFIEWVVEDGEFVEQIGLELQGKSVVGYDGVFSMPSQAIELLEDYGYDCFEIK